MASSVFLKPSGTGAAHVMQFGPVGSKIPFLTSRQISTGLIAEKTTSMAILDSRKNAIAARLAKIVTSSVSRPIDALPITTGVRSFGFVRLPPISLECNELSKQIFELARERHCDSRQRFRLQPAAMTIKWPAH